MKNNIIYSGVFVNENELKRMFPQIHENSFYHHSTIEFKPKNIDDLPIGDIVTLNITGRLTNDKIDAIVVDNKFSKKEYPHITLSTAKDIKPHQTNIELKENNNKIKPITNKKINGIVGYFDGKNIIYENKINIINLIKEEVKNHQNFLKWKRNNITLRGIRKGGETVNNGSSLLGKGLYTAPLSNKKFAREYGKVYYVLGAKPDKPIKFNTLNDWEIYLHNRLIVNFYKKINYDDFFDQRKFYEETTIEDELLKQGYDGVLIKGREMVNFKPDEDNIRYFENDNQLENYYYDFV